MFLLEGLIISSMVELIVGSIILFQIGGKLCSEQVHLQEKDFINVVCQNI